jgi:Mn-dependent DtxR family transcriptional regulator
MKVRTVTGEIIIVDECTALENLILSVLWSLHKPDEEFCHIKQSEICKILGCNTASFIRATQRLQDTGLIECTKYALRNKVKGYKVVLPDQ